MTQKELKKKLNDHAIYLNNRYRDGHAGPAALLSRDILRGARDHIATLESERDRWKREALAARNRPRPDWYPQDEVECNCRDCQAYNAARAANTPEQQEKSNG